MAHIPAFLSRCFYPRHPRGWRRCELPQNQKGGTVSIHATLAGGDGGLNEVVDFTIKFLSTPPSRVATHGSSLLAEATPVSIHATLAGGDLVVVGYCGCRHDVSIHATLAGGDAVNQQTSAIPKKVSIHATLAGGDVFVGVTHYRAILFLSTPPSRVATGWKKQYNAEAKFLSTPPSRVATSTRQGMNQALFCFYPRHPRGWRPEIYAKDEHGRYVSIHATLAGGDLMQGGLQNWQAISFYPRHPRGWRLTRKMLKAMGIEVSIHATLAGGDSATCRPRVRARCFYPRHPRGWRLKANSPVQTGKYVSIHATLAGGDRLRAVRPDSQECVSIHATLAGGDI